MNKGLNLYSGDAVGFLNADDRLADSGALSAIAEGLQELLDIVSGHLDFVTDHASSQVVRRWRGTPYARGAFRKGWMPAHPTFYVRRAVIDAVGRFDLRFKIAADYDFMLRAFELNQFSARHFGPGAGQDDDGWRQYARRLGLPQEQHRVAAVPASEVRFRPRRLRAVCQAVAQAWPIYR